MTTLTKKVTITYGNSAMQEGSSDNPFTIARWTKMQELKLAEKTDGNVSISLPSSSIINFVDQATAEEYRDCILDAATASNGNIEIVSSSITDI